MHKAKKKFEQQYRNGNRSSDEVSVIFTEERDFAMKNPLHYQLSEYDCGPTSMMNALAYLFEREEIPPEAIRNMMLYCLDCHSKEGIPGKRGTSRAAMMFLSNWLNEYGELGIMSVSSEYLSGRSVYINKESRINHALNHGGAAVVRLYLEEEHYVLMTGVENGNILLFDPYYWDKPYEQKDILMDWNHPRSYNRVVPFKYFNQENEEIYSLGPVEEREAVLIFNEKTKTVPEEVIEYFI